MASVVHSAHGRGIGEGQLFPSNWQRFSGGHEIWFALGHEGHKPIRDNKIFWVFMEMNLRMGINYKPRLSPTVYNSLQSFVEFKADLHSIYIRARKDPAK